MREVRGTEKYPVVHSLAPSAENYPVQNVSSTKVEDSCVGGHDLIKQ